MEARERRRGKRYVYPYTVLIQGARPVSTYTENISEGGIRVVIRDILETGAVVGLQIFIAEQPLVCEGRVVWRREKTSTVLESTVVQDTGIEFVHLGRNERARLAACLRERRE
ncbi:MAG: hypothetical protein GF333_06490 [Candidatus Omnitrophica bacterium]|nr:hypothetical protein [Candidatus Omnitrophota bacterium]